MTETASRVRGWCMTLHDYTDADYTRLLNTPCDYVIIGKETCPTTGRKHLQAYFHWKNKKAFGALKKLSATAHWEAAKGSILSNYNYCKKEGAFEERGTRPTDNDEPSRQTAAKLKRAEQIKTTWELAKAGKFEQLPPAQIHNWEYIRAKYGEKPHDRDHLRNYWIHGPSGCGKSSAVRRIFNEGEAYSKPMNKWWDGYQNEPVVIIEDVDPSHAEWISFYLKIWADHYVFNAEVKGGMLRIRPPVLVVTSQYSIEQVLAGRDKETNEAISRRFTDWPYTELVPGMLEGVKQKLLEENEPKHPHPVPENPPDFSAPSVDDVPTTSSSSSSSVPLSLEAPTSVVEVDCECFNVEEEPLEEEEWVTFNNKKRKVVIESDEDSEDEFYI